MRRRRGLERALKKVADIGDKSSKKNLVKHREPPPPNHKENSIYVISPVPRAQLSLPAKQFPARRLTASQSHYHRSRPALILRRTNVERPPGFLTHTVHTDDPALSDFKAAVTLDNLYKTGLSASTVCSYSPSLISHRPSCFPLLSVAFPISRLSALLQHQSLLWQETPSKNITLQILSR